MKAANTIRQCKAAIRSAIQAAMKTQLTAATWFTIAARIVR